MNISSHCYQVNNIHISHGITLSEKDVDPELFERIESIYFFRPDIGADKIHQLLKDGVSESNIFDLPCSHSGGTQKQVTHVKKLPKPANGE
ncbi:MAG: hypothetical protein ACI9TY_000222 [Alphaproteobacteria bacterium]|jgi:hypothetical protein